MEPASLISSRPAAGSRLRSISLNPAPGEDISGLCRRLARELDASGSVALHFLCFGDLRAAGVVRDLLRHHPATAGCPMTWCEGASCAGHPVAGIQAHAFQGAVDRVEREGGPIASVFTEGEARQCIVGGVTGPGRTLSREAQTARALESLQGALEHAGFGLADVMRTWFYLDDILSWYDGFNRERSRIYSGIRFRTGSLPASTGIGAANPSGSALTLAAWAFRPASRIPEAVEIASPLQCPAPAYGSSFSRAMETSSNTGRRLFVSGTASIEPGGATVWPGDTRRQVDLTMEVVQAILVSRGMVMSDIVRATAYFRRAADAPLIHEWLRKNRLEAMPLVAARSDICRDDLLFELEAEAETRIAL